MLFVRNLVTQTRYVRAIVTATCLTRPSLANTTPCRPMSAACLVRTAPPIATQFSAAPDIYKQQLRWHLKRSKRIKKEKDDRQKKLKQEFGHELPTGENNVNHVWDNILKARLFFFLNSDFLVEQLFVR